MSFGFAARSRTSQPGAIGSCEAVRFAVLRLDLVQEPAQRRPVGGVPWQDLIGQRKTFGGDDQRDHYLHAVAALRLKPEHPPAVCRLCGAVATIGMYRHKRQESFDGYLLMRLRAML
jgi:hypothetical protein